MHLGHLTTKDIMTWPLAMMMTWRAGETPIMKGHLLLLITGLSQSVDLVNWSLCNDPPGSASMSFPSYGRYLGSTSYGPTRPWVMIAHPPGQHFLDSTSCNLFFFIYQFHIPYLVYFPSFWSITSGILLSVIPTQLDSAC